MSSYFAVVAFAARRFRLNIVDSTDRQKVKASSLEKFTILYQHNTQKGKDVFMQSGERKKGNETTTSLMVSANTSTTLTTTLQLGYPA